MFQFLRLSAGAPHVLDETVALRQAVEGVVALAHGADEAAEGVGLVLAGVPAVLVDLANGELDRGVVLGLDDAVGRRALAGDVAVTTVRKMAPLSWDVGQLRMLPPVQHSLMAPGFARTGPRARHVRSPFLRLR